MGSPERAHDWALDLFVRSASTCPASLLEEAMAHPQCVAFGPVHHFLVGAALLTCWHNARALPNRDEALRADLEEMLARSGHVPGATCARWGVCGAAASMGMAYAIVRGNAPLKADGWAEGQLVVADLLARIAQSGSPRCCKRDARIAVDAAVAHFDALGGPSLERLAQAPVCATMAANSACLGPACPYHP